MTARRDAGLTDGRAARGSWARRVAIAMAMAFVAVFPACTSTRACKEKSILLNVSLGSVANTASQLEVDVTVNGKAQVPLTWMPSGTAFAKSESLEIDVPNYKAGETFAITVFARTDAGAVLASGTVNPNPTTAPAGCLATTVQLMAPSANGGAGGGAATGGAGGQSSSGGSGGGGSGGGTNSSGGGSGNGGGAIGTAAGIGGHATGGGRGGAGGSVIGATGGAAGSASGASGGDAGRGGGAGGGVAGAGGATDPCVGKVCNTPLQNTCPDPTHLRAYDTIGSCSAGVCTYSSQLVTCTCTNGACSSDPCTSVTCNTQPSPICADASTRRTFAAGGTCAGGSCSYAPTDTACPFGCSNGACQSDPCAGVTCTSPPTPTCITNPANTRRTFAKSGTCGAGSCTYTSSDMVCPYGCTNGACKLDPSTYGTTVIAGSVTCGPSLICTGGTPCCYDWTTKIGTCGACRTGNPPINVPCDGPNDCGAGQVCCDVSMPGNTEFQCATGVCPSGGMTGSNLLCDPDAPACPTGSTCTATSIHSDGVIPFFECL